MQKSDSAIMVKIQCYILVFQIAILIYISLKSIIFMICKHEGICEYACRLSIIDLSTAQKLNVLSLNKQSYKAGERSFNYDLRESKI
jgi:hypothetical protein